jgi:hypothetical protein
LASRAGPSKPRPAFQDKTHGRRIPDHTLHFLDYWRVIRDRKEVILAVALLTIVTGTAYTLMMPKKFTATTQLEVREDAMDVDPFYSREASAAWATTPSS